MRLYTIIVSIGAHVAALIVLVAVPLLAMDVVPIAYRVHVFVPAAAAELPDMPPPPRGRSASHSQASCRRSADGRARSHRTEKLPIPGSPGIVPSDSSWRHAGWCRRRGSV